MYWFQCRPLQELEKRIRERPQIRARELLRRPSTSIKSTYRPRSRHWWTKSTTRPPTCWRALCRPKLLLKALKLRSVFWPSIKSTRAEKFLPKSSLFSRYCSPTIYFISIVTHTIVGRRISDPRSHAASAKVIELVLQCNSASHRKIIRRAVTCRHRLTGRTPRETRARTVNERHC